MSTAILRSEDVLRSRFHLHAFGYRPPPTQPPMKLHRRKTPPAGRPAAAAPPPSSSSSASSASASAAAASAAAATSPPPHKRSRSGPARPSGSLPKPARTGRKPRPAAGAGKENDGGAASAVADDPRHHSRSLVMEKVTILKRGEAMKPSAPVLAGSNGADVPKKSGFPAVDPVYAGPGFSVFSPEPSSLPHPGFLLRHLAATEEATTSLLRLLRLHKIYP